jgi:hypothetical protein
LIIFKLLKIIVINFVHYLYVSALLMMGSFFPSEQEKNGEPEGVEDKIRIFTRQMKQKCWEQAPIVPGRDPSRWRLDAVGII